MDRISRKVRQFSSLIHDVLMGANLASLRLSAHPRRLRRYLHELLFLQQSLAPIHFEPKSIAAMFVKTGDIRIAGVENAENWLAWGPAFAVDIVNLSLLCRAINPKVVFEIGTFHGYTTLHLALNTADDAKILTLDLPTEREISLHATYIDHEVISDRNTMCLFSGRPEETKIQRLYGDSAIFDFSPYAGQVDLFFIDGSHSYEYVKSDTLKALECCHPGSVIVWHDYGREQFGVTKLLKEFSRRLRVHVVPGSSLAFAVIGSRRE